MDFTGFLDSPEKWPLIIQSIFLLGCSARPVDGIEILSWRGGGSLEAGLARRLFSGLTVSAFRSRMGRYLGFGRRGRGFMLAVQPKAGKRRSVEPPAGGACCRCRWMACSVPRPTIPSGSQADTRGLKVFLDLLQDATLGVAIVGRVGEAIEIDPWEEACGSSSSFTDPGGSIEAGEGVRRASIGDGSGLQLRQYTGSRLRG